MAKSIDPVRRVIAAVMAMAVLVAVVAGIWSHGAHAAVGLTPPCHEVTKSAAAAPNCAALCEVSSLSDIAINLKASVGGSADARAAVAAISQVAKAPPVRLPGRHWRPPALQPLAITQRRLI